jgi:hypothetical protein
MAQVELTKSYTTYQGQTKLLELMVDLAEARVIKGELREKYNIAVKIRLWLKALSYSTYLDKPTIDKLVYCLAQLCDANALPYAPVITSIAAPTLSIGGSRTTNNITYTDGVAFSNADVDTGTETIDSFDVGDAFGCVWHYTVRSGSNQRSGIIVGSWIASGASVSYFEDSTDDIGDTDDVTLAVDFSGGTIRLRATAASDDWTIHGTRYLMD